MPVSLHISVARSVWHRAIGLLSQSDLADNMGLLLCRCSGIHTWGMQFAIDVVFFDMEGMVIHIVEKVKPWRFVYGVRADFCLELKAGMARYYQFQVGQKFDSLGLALIKNAPVIYFRNGIFASSFSL